MTIFKSVINVNNGNTGWTRQHVMDALETAFSQLGYNGGSAVAGVPCACLAPGRTAANGNPAITDVNWSYCGGPAVSSYSSITRNFYVTNNGTSSYNVLEQWFSGSTSVANDTLTFTRHILNTGDPLTFNPGGSVTGTTITPLVNDTTYYVIKIDGNTIKLAATLDDATNGIAINLTGTTGTTSNLPFRRPFNVLYNNYQIDIEMGDTINMTVVDTTSGGGLYFQDNIDAGYNTSRILNSSNFQGQSYKSYPTGMNGANPNWPTRGWPQTEDEDISPEDVPGTGYVGTFKYGYVNSANPSMKGVIRILPGNSNNNLTDNLPYWKYTVPASGGRSSLKLRIYRFPAQYSDHRKIAYISIHSIGSGWQDNDTFTIPGSAIGGVDVTNDIAFGINSATSVQQANGSGVCNIITTNIGAGSTMYQKHPSGFFGVVKVVNDATKTYGTTYWGIGLDYTNSYRIYLNCGPNWRFLNTTATKCAFQNGGYGYGNFGGDRGLDWQQSYNYITNDSNNWTSFDYATTATPTAYPLSIRIYRAQSPQDTNFAIIQFTQTINNAIVPYATFSIMKGPNVGANVWDLNYVWNGGITQYGLASRGITFNYFTGASEIYSGTEGESIQPQALMREANYGYLRNGGRYGRTIAYTRYECNIDTDNEISPGYYSTGEHQVVTYYRNSTYDRYSNSDTINNYADRNNRTVSALANYYKPMKGIPITQQLLPCPYYLPDDFVLLQVSTSPGLTVFRPGDTVTISPSEIYEIILAGYQTQQNGLDGINNNSSIGMLLLARTT